MINLHFPDAISDARDLHCRESELRRIEDRFIQGGRAVIVEGERRAGKTSLLNVSLRRLQERTDFHFIPLRIEVGEITSFPDLAEQILKRLADALGKPIPANTPEDVHDFRKACAGLISSTSPVIGLLCLDEFEEILRRLSGSADAAQVLALMNALMEDVLPLRLFLTLTYRLPMMQRDTSSPLITRSDVVPLEPFDAQGTGQMVRALLCDEVHVDDDAVAWLFKMSGGHPYFIKLPLAVLVQRGRLSAFGATLTPALLDAALAEMVADARAGFTVENIYQNHFTDSQKAVVLTLADREGPLSADEVRELTPGALSAAKDLKKRGYLARGVEGYDFRIGYLRLWLRSWSQLDDEIDRLAQQKVQDIETVVSIPPNPEVTDEDLRRYGLSSELHA